MCVLKKALTEDGLAKARARSQEASNNHCKVQGRDCEGWREEWKKERGLDGKRQNLGRDRAESIESL